ncbi:hypothetical protein ACQPZ2_29765 [Nocardia pseudovaccinii]|uniref:hypothetical protein n=1 Tax=Nocardia pseudovaccinii TaxID=189540 RepID=UPI003D89F358
MASHARPAIRLRRAGQSMSDPKTPELPPNSMGIDMKKMTCVVSLAIAGTAALGTGTASATPGSQPMSVDDTRSVSVQIFPGVQYSSNVDDSSAVISTPFGTVTSVGGKMSIADAAGRTLSGQQGFAMTPETAATVPDTVAGESAPAPAVSVPVAGPRQIDDAAPVSPKDPMADFEAALAVAGGNFGLATGVGSMAGGLMGAAVGCPLGIVTGGILTAPTVIGTPLGIIGGCILGAGAVGGVGAILGGAALGVPVGIASAVQMYNTLHAQGDI